MNARCKGKKYVPSTSRSGLIIGREEISMYSTFSPFISSLLISGAAKPMRKIKIGGNNGSNEGTNNEATSTNEASVA